MGINDKRYNTLNKGLMERWGYKITEEEEEELEEGGAAQRKGDPRVRRQDTDRLREEDESEEDVVEEGEEEEELEESTIGSYSSGDQGRKYQARGTGPGPGEDCDPEKDVTCVPEPGEKVRKAQAKERYGESMIRKIVRETIRRKLKKNG